MSKTVIITGANSGLGFETAKAILEESSDYYIILACRSLERASTAISQLQSIRPTVEVMELDLASFKSIRSFADAFKSRTDLPPLYSIVCNAGSQFITTYTETTDGIEATFGVNHLGHFLLVLLLADKLTTGSRVILVSSGTHDPKEKTGMPYPVYDTAEHLAHPPEKFSLTSGPQYYTNSKLCNVLFAYELSRKLKDKSVSVNAYDPGLLPGTGLVRDHYRIMQLVWYYVLPWFRSLIPNTHLPSESGRALAHLTIDPKYENVTGKYFNLETEKHSSDLSYDVSNQEDLWKSSISLTGLKQSETSVPL